MWMLSFSSALCIISVISCVKCTDNEQDGQSITATTVHTAAKNDSSSGKFTVYDSYWESFTVDELIDRRKTTYEHALSCIKNSKVVPAKTNPFPNWEFPEDAEAHYQDLLKKTEKFRHVPIHTHGHHGMWIENYWIEQFIDKPLSYFNGYIPLFVQFVDIHVNGMGRKKGEVYDIPDWKGLIEILVPLLRPNVLYLAVSQDDCGIFEKMHQSRPNVLVLSAGGYGHVPIPLIKGEMAWNGPKKMDEFEIDVGFFGHPHPRLSRNRMISDIKASAQNHKMVVKYAQSPDWIQNMEKTKFNLAPRGYGRTSYRLAEVIQMGRVPVYVYDDVCWLPYKNTNVSLEHYGYIGRMGAAGQLIAQFRQTSEEQYQQKLQNLAEVRHLYTYEGAIQQIELFIQDPTGAVLSGGYLSCMRVPDREHRHR